MPTIQHVISIACPNQTVNHSFYQINLDGDTLFLVKGGDEFVVKDQILHGKIDHLFDPSHIGCAVASTLNCELEIIDSGHFPKTPCVIET